MKIYYRLSNKNAGGEKNKLIHATKEYCLKNTIDVFGKDNITVVGDKLNDKTRQIVTSHKIRLVEVDNGSGAGTFRDALKLAVEENKDNDIVYLLEDDFLHLKKAKELIEEGVKTFNCYITGYDHPDKYLDRRFGGNPSIEHGGEITRLVKSQTSHWKITNSTVMSFAATTRRLRKDLDLLYKFSSNSITDSYGFFTSLSGEKGVGCLSSVPGVSTHTEIKWLSPFINWNVI